MLFKKTFAIFVAAMLIMNMSSAAVYAASDKIGFIDTQLVLVSHPKYDESQKQVDDFITKKTEEARAAAEKESDANKRMEIIDLARRESGREELRVMNPITDQINKVIETVAKSKGVSIVLDRVYIFYGGVDLTEEVVKSVKALK